MQRARTRQRAARGEPRSGALSHRLCRPRPRHCRRRSHPANVDADRQSPTIGRQATCFRSKTRTSMDLQRFFEQLIGRQLLSAHQWLFETTDGRVTWLGGLPVLLLRTIGRKTGAERTAALVYLQDGKDLVVVASNGG